MSRLAAFSMKIEEKNSFKRTDGQEYTPVTGMITHDATNFYLMACNLANSSNSFYID